MHRNSQKRIYGDHIYFITCVVHDKMEFFTCGLLCEVWMKELNLCKTLHKFKLMAFCLNYNHFHFIIKPDNAVANYSEIMKFLKRNFSQNTNKILGFNALKTKTGNTSNERDNTPNEGDNTHCRLHWQIEMDDFVAKMREKFISIYGTNHDFPKFKWQKSFHDHIIREQHDYDNHWNYTMYNFAKHGLPENWRYTGLNYPEMLDER